MFLSNLEASKCVSHSSGLKCWDVAFHDVRCILQIGTKTVKSWTNKPKLQHIKSWQMFGLHALGITTSHVFCLHYTTLLKRWKFGLRYQQFSFISLLSRISATANINQRFISPIFSMCLSVCWKQKDSLPSIVNIWEGFMKYARLWSSGNEEGAAWGQEMKTINCLAKRAAVLNMVT